VQLHQADRCPARTGIPAIPKVVNLLLRIEDRASPTLQPTDIDRVPLGNVLQRREPTDRSASFHAREQGLVNGYGGSQRGLGLALGFSEQSEATRPPARFGCPTPDFSTLDL